MVAAQERPPQAQQERVIGNYLSMFLDMKAAGKALESSNPSTEKVISGHGDTGTIVTDQDLQVSERLLRIARGYYPGSFSEENDPKVGRTFIRLLPRNRVKGIWMIDPIDGTGDRKYGEVGSPERKGYSILSSFINPQGKIEASIVVRPAYNQELLYRHGDTYLSQKM